MLSEAIARANLCADTKNLEPETMIMIISQCNEWHVAFWRQRIGLLEQSPAKWTLKREGIWIELAQADDSDCSWTFMVVSEPDFVAQVNSRQEVDKLLVRYGAPKTAELDTCLGSEDAKSYVAPEPDPPL